MQSSYSKFLLAFSCLVLTLSAPLPLLSMENEKNEKAPATVVPTLQEKKWKDELYEFPEIETGFKIKVFNTLFLNPDFKNGENQKALFECLEKAAFERLNLQALEKVKLFSTQSVLHVSRLDPEKEKKAQKFLGQYSFHNELAKIQKVPLGTYAFNIGLGYKEGARTLPIDHGLAKKFLLFSLEWSSESTIKSSALLTLGLLHEERRLSTAANLKSEQHFSLNYERDFELFNTGNLNNSEIQYKLGCYYQKLERYNEAVMWFEKALNQCRKESKT